MALPIVRRGRRQALRGAVGTGFEQTGAQVNFSSVNNGAAFTLPVTGAPGQPRNSYCVILLKSERTNPKGDLYQPWYIGVHFTG